MEIETAYQTLQDAAKAVLEGMLITLNAYIENTELDKVCTSSPNYLWAEAGGLLELGAQGQPRQYSETLFHKKGKEKERFPII